MNQKIVIYVSGRSCSGKSALIKELAEKIPGIFKVSYDHLKFELSGYDRNVHIPLIRQITLDLFAAVCRKSIPILLDSFSHNQEQFDEIKNIIKKYGYKLRPIYLTAPDDVLLERHRERVINAQKTGKKLSMSDETVFKTWLEVPYFKPTESIEFDTSKIDINTISEQVLAML